MFEVSHKTEKLEQICRYIARSAIHEQRLSIIESGSVRYELKTPYSNCTTHVFFTLLNFIGIVPPPRLNLRRLYGVISPNAKVRAKFSASQRGKNSLR
ncbi:transposase [Alteromonas portus]|uniref:transposase n=1 Tax=Alteromonas portus TaxID=2565549 RepID=UPI003BF878A8